MKIFLMVILCLVGTSTWAATDGTSKNYCFNLLKRDEVASACGKKGLIMEDWNQSGAAQCNVVYIRKNPKLPVKTFESGSPWMSLRESDKHKSVQDAKIWYNFTKKARAAAVSGLGDAAWVTQRDKKTVVVGFRKKDRVFVLRSENNLCSSDQLKKIAHSVAKRLP